MPQVFLLLFICIFTTASAQLCFRKGVLKWGELDFSFSQVFSLIPQIFQNVWIMLGICLFGVSFILWLFILSRLHLNIAYPIVLSSEIIITTAAAWFLFKEYISPIQILGIVVIIVGIFLLLKG